MLTRLLAIRVTPRREPGSRINPLQRDGGSDRRGRGGGLERGDVIRR